MVDERGYSSHDAATVLGVSNENTINHLGNPNRTAVPLVPSLSYQPWNGGRHRWSTVDVRALWTLHQFDLIGPANQTGGNQLVARRRADTRRIWDVMHDPAQTGRFLILYDGVAWRTDTPGRTDDRPIGVTRMLDLADAPV